MARHTSSSFDITDGFFEKPSKNVEKEKRLLSETKKDKSRKNIENTYEVDEVQEVSNVQETYNIKNAHDVQDETDKKRKFEEHDRIVNSKDLITPVLDKRLITEGKQIGTTQGRKGMKLRRINMAFSDINYEYVKKTSRMNGMSATEFINMLIDEHRTIH